MRNFNDTNFFTTAPFIVGATVFSIVGTFFAVLTFTSPQVELPKRWEELSNWEISFMQNCVEHQPYKTCLRNVDEMRQIGIIPLPQQQH